MMGLYEQYMYMIHTNIDHTSPTIFGDKVLGVPVVVRIGPHHQIPCPRFVLGHHVITEVIIKTRAR